MKRPLTFYFDLGSPYAYLAAERIAQVIGEEPRFEPVLVGGIFSERGFGSWAHTPEKPDRIAEVESRAGRYGLPPVAWPAGWPNNTLQAMRAAVWAQRAGIGRAFAVAALRRAFQRGADLSRLEHLAAIAVSLEASPDEMTDAIQSTEIKAALREKTARAWARGVSGVPCLEVAEEIYYGDDRLEEAAQRLARGAG